MKKNLALSRLIVGLLLTVLVYFVAMFVGHRWHLNCTFLSDSVLGHTTMLVLSIVLILVFKKQVNYRIGCRDLVHHQDPHLHFCFGFDRRLLSGETRQPHLRHSGAHGWQFDGIDLPDR